jgi:hypothetical protein
MRQSILIAILLLSTTLAAGYSVDKLNKHYVFHCEGKEVLCGDNLSENYTLYLAPASSLTDDGNISNMEKADRSDIRELDDFPYQENQSFLTSTRHTGKKISIEYSSGEEIHEGSMGFKTNYHFYPKDNYSRSNLTDQEGCWSAQIEEVGDFHHVNQEPALDEWHCITRRSNIAGGPPIMINIKSEWSVFDYFNPLNWLVVAANT